MSTRPFLRLGSVKNVEGFLDYVRAHGLQIPCDKEVVGGPDSPLMVPLAREGIQNGNSQRRDMQIGEQPHRITEVFSLASQAAYFAAWKTSSISSSG